MSFKTLLAAVAFATAALSAGQAAAQDRTALAQEVVQLMGVEETVRTMFEAMSPMMAASMAPELSLTPTEQARLGELLAEEFRTATPEFISRLSGVYANSLNEQQLREVISFLRSPAGNAWVQTQNTAERELERIGQEVGMRVAFQALMRLNAERSR